MKYLLVLGTQRTGKTLIGRALNMHPNIIVQVEPYFYFFKMCRNLFYRDVLKKTDFDPDYPMDSCFCRPYEEKVLFSQSFHRLYFSRSDIKELVRLTIKQQRISSAERAIKIIPLLNRLRPGGAFSVFKCLMDILYESYAKEGVEIVGLTEGWCDEFIQPFLDSKDIDIKCIHCLRDPRAVVASRNFGDRIYSRKYPLLFILRHWRKSVAYSILHTGNPRYMAVKYEELVQEPESHFKEICNFLNVPFSKELLKPLAFVKGDGTLWKQNSAFHIPASRGFSKGSIARWKKVLSKEEIGVIEYLCEAEMGYLGFRRSVPRISAKELLYFQENEDQIIPWLKKYKYTFSEKQIIPEIVRRYILEESQVKQMDYLADYFLIDKRIREKLPK